MLAVCAALLFGAILGITIEPLIQMLCYVTGGTDTL